MNKQARVLANAAAKYNNHSGTTAHIYDDGIALFLPVSVATQQKWERYLRRTLVGSARSDDGMFAALILKGDVLEIMPRIGRRAKKELSFAEHWWDDANTIERACQLFAASR